MGWRGCQGFLDNFKVGAIAVFIQFWYNGSMSKKYNNLDKNGRLPVSVEPKRRDDFNRVINEARRLGFNRSKFVVMAVLMAGVDLGLVDLRRAIDE